MKIYIFDFISFEHFDSFNTCKNSSGLVSIATEPDNTIIAYPSEEQGHVIVKTYNSLKESIEKDIQAHESNIACFSLNNNGSLLATASDKGTLIRVFNVIDGTRVKELRRGSENAFIYSISFDRESKFLCCTSDRTTVHIFAIENREFKNHISFMSKVTKLFNKNSNTYFDSEWSFAQFKINETKSIGCFGANNTIIIVTANGKYYQAQFDPTKEGNCKKINEAMLTFEK